jgi:hypothetical protein
MVPFYNAGDTMCSDGYQWMSDSLTQMACGNGFCWQSVSVATDVYIAFRKTNTPEIAWLKISFDIFWAYPVTASVGEVLVYCTATGTASQPGESFFSISPIPSADGKISLKSRNPIAVIEIINALGQVVKTIPGGGSEIMLPGEPGLYIVMLTDNMGNRRAEKAWRE